MLRQSTVAEMNGRVEIKMEICDSEVLFSGWKKYRFFKFIMHVIIYNE
jgi:hypothetical protein